jgi:hypothetical protein
MEPTAPKRRPRATRAMEVESIESPEPADVRAYARLVARILARADKSAVITDAAA